MDVGRGSGSCNSDCDCPLCAPFCSTSGYCQNHQRAGRRKCTSDSAYASTEPVSACPPLLGDPAPPGCNKTFVEDSDGGIPCQSLYHHFTFIIRLSVNLTIKANMRRSMDDGGTNMTTVPSPKHGGVTSGSLRYLMPVIFHPVILMHFHLM